jgi:hypothetical protein
MMWNTGRLHYLPQRFPESRVLTPDDSLQRLRLLFGDNPNITQFCARSAADDVNLKARMLCRLSRPVNDKNVVKEKPIASGLFGRTFKCKLQDVVGTASLDPRLLGQSVVVKQSTRSGRNVYRDTLHELLINHCALRERVVVDGLPNFAAMYTYIVCKPRAIDDQTPFCTDDVVDISAMTTEQLDTELSAGTLQLFGVYELINGVTLTEFIQSLIASADPEGVDKLADCLVQVFAALASLNKMADAQTRQFGKSRFSHCDLHANNVMIEKTMIDYSYVLSEDGNEVLKLEGPLRAVIIDCGMSIAKFDDHSVDTNFIAFFQCYFMEAEDVISLLRDCYVVALQATAYKPSAISQFLEQCITGIFGPNVMKFLFLQFTGPLQAYRYVFYLQHFQSVPESTSWKMYETWTLIKAIDVIADIHSSLSP